MVRVSAPLFCFNLRPHSMLNALVFSLLVACMPFGQDAPVTHQDQGVYECSTRPPLANIGSPQKTFGARVPPITMHHRFVAAPLSERQPLRGWHSRRLASLANTVADSPVQSGLGGSTNPKLGL
jgi:hypothetical protein